MLEEVEEAAQESAEPSLAPEKHPRHDPNLRDVEMPYSASHYPLGFPVRVTTNSLDVLAGADASWGRFEQQIAMEPICIQMGVRDDGTTECPGVLTFRAHQHLLTGVADGGNFFVSDLMRDISFGWVTAAAARYGLYLRHHVLEAVAMNHIANRYTAPVHAACVARGGRGVLLCGNAGAGKSTLALGCARAGWTYVSDDSTFLTHGRSDRRAVGNCHSMRLRPESAAFFSELRGRPLTPRMRGKPSIEIATAELPGMQTAGECEVEYAVFLNRDAKDEQELVPYSREAARRYMLQHLSGWEPLRREQIESVERILSVPVYELRYRDLDWAISRLECMVLEAS